MKHKNHEGPVKKTLSFEREFKSVKGGTWNQSGNLATNVDEHHKNFSKFYHFICLCIYFFLAFSIFDFWLYLEIYFFEMGIEFEDILRFRV